MAEEAELLQQQLEEVSINLAQRDVTLAERDATVAERDAALSAERALRMSTEAAVQSGTARGSGRPMQQASAGQPVPEPDYRHHQIPRRSSCRRKTACGCPCLMSAVSCICGHTGSKLS